MQALLDVNEGNFCEVTGEYAVDILVPNKAVAYLIGRGGVVISGMQNQSGAKVKVARSSNVWYCDIFRRVTLSGTPESVHNARTLIDRKLRSYDDLYGRGTKGGAGSNTGSSGGNNPINTTTSTATASYSSSQNGSKYNVDVCAMFTWLFGWLAQTSTLNKNVT
jgi:hypothetical protein